MEKVNDTVCCHKDVRANMSPFAMFCTVLQFVYLRSHILGVPDVGRRVPGKCAVCQQAGRYYCEMEQEQPQGLRTRWR